MEKLLIFPTRTDKGIFAHVIDTEQAYLTKIAAEYHPQVAQYINSAKSIPGKTQILLTALGAGEYWGANVNGDYFPESDLEYNGPEYGHKTFETNAKLYKHHINKDPTASYGDVALSVYNKSFHRVELIVIIDNAKAPDIVERINNGESVEFSMGTRVKFDVCSICGNRAPTRAQYCEHLKYYMGRIHPGTGKMVYAINPRPVFFDISYVLIGADKTAKILLKVAHRQHVAYHGVSSAYIAEKMAGIKSAEIEKEVPATQSPGSQDSIMSLVGSIPEVMAQEKSIPAQQLNDMASSNPLPKILSTLAMMGIIPKPQEFQRIILVCSGKKDIADSMDRQNICFDPSSIDEPSELHEKIVGLSPDNFDPNICRAMSSHIPDRSYAMPHLMKRIIIMVKQAQPENLPTFIKVGKDDVDKRFTLPAPVLLAMIAGAYSALAKKAPATAVVGLDKLIVKHPFLAAALASAAPMMFNQVAGNRPKGNYAEGSESEMSNMAARIDDQKAKPFTKIAAVGPMAKRMFVGIPAVYMGAGILQKQKNADPQGQENRIAKFIRKNPDLISAALVTDTLLGKSGLSGTIKQHARDFIKKGCELIKVADVQDYITNAILWPVAFGPKNLPARMVGGLLDQAVIEGGKNLLSRKKNSNKIS